jgi:hypothetical protein
MELMGLLAPTHVPILSIQIIISKYVVILLATAKTLGNMH